MSRATRKSIGITKTIDNLGRLVLPSDLRKELDIDYPSAEVEIKLALVNKKKVIEIRKKGIEE